MHMDTAALVHKCPMLLQLSDDLLDGNNVLILTDGTDHFCFIFRVSPLLSSTDLFLGFNAAVAHKFPLPSLRIQCSVGIIISPQVTGTGPEILCHNFSRSTAGNAGHLNFNSKPLFPEIHLPLPPLSPACLSKQPRLVLWCVDH